jgi:hypothetical protein
LTRTADNNDWLNVVAWTGTTEQRGGASDASPPASFNGADPHLTVDRSAPEVPFAQQQPTECGNTFARETPAEVGPISSEQPVQQFPAQDPTAIGSPFGPGPGAAAPPPGFPPAAAPQPPVSSLQAQTARIERPPSQSPPAAAGWNVPPPAAPPPAPAGWDSPPPRSPPFPAPAGRGAPPEAQHRGAPRAPVFGSSFADEGPPADVGSKAAPLPGSSPFPPEPDGAGLDPALGTPGAGDPVPAATEREGGTRQLEAAALQAPRDPANAYAATSRPPPRGPNLGREIDLAAGGLGASIPFGEIEPVAGESRAAETGANVDHEIGTAPPASPAPAPSPAAPAPAPRPSSPARWKPGIGDILAGSLLLGIGIWVGDSLLTGSPTAAGILFDAVGFGWTGFGVFKLLFRNR